MLNKKILTITVASYLFSSSLFGLSLQDSVTEVLDTNPVIQERLKNFRSIQQDLNIANSEYYPKLDLKLSVGHNEAGNLKGGKSTTNLGDKWKHKVEDKNYNNYESSLIFTQNIFDGFGTMHKVSYEETRILAAAYKYLESSNDIAFKMTSAYINVIRTQELTKTAKENVQINETIYSKVQELFDSGLTTDSEVKKIKSSLSLARSNFTVQKNNAREMQYSFRRVFGRMPDIDKMSKPTLNIVMPESIERAAIYSIEHNPSLLVSRYNIKGAQALYKQRQKDYYPTLDLEVSQSFNDNDDSFSNSMGGIDNNGYDSTDDRFRIRLVLNYNLFRGGADRANVQKHLSKINQEIEIKRDLKRQVIEGLDLSWNSYEMVEEQLKDLRDYSKYSEETLALYEEEYDLGRRSLLDLLSSQNDVINSRSQIITAEYDLLFAKYRILDAMGLLVSAVTGDTSNVTSKVNLHSGDEAKEILDTLSVDLDLDNDKIPDNIDLCDNSLLENNIMPYGCKKLIKDEDGDGVIDSKDSCLMTPSDAVVSPDGCAVDNDKDGVKDYADKCPKTPVGHNVNDDGCSISFTLRVNFDNNSTDIPKSDTGSIDKFVDFLNDNKDYNVLIIGHTNSLGDSSDNLKLSQNRAISVKKTLVLNGIDVNRLSSEGRGEEEPISDNDTAVGLYLNRRVDIELTKQSEEF